MPIDIDAGLEPAEATPFEAAHTGDYVVVARRYRPKSFDELVGQQQVAQALSNAITTNRVGHAYLFTGARGVGKTSTARILAKCLNCVTGPTPTPCGMCDNCAGIASGDDVDVLEIDGASNRGIDEIRQLRANVNVRPSRARFKIYIIDEVHMLTVPAFNALLKTLEEPPGHVKFIFCTTDPEKIPITVLSRCQRFDFPPVPTESILARLRHIVESERVEAEDAALQLLARRAAGSMRDSQSLLEQLLSFCGRRITEADVHAMLGTARGGRLAAIAEQLIARNAAGALAQLDGAMSEGVDAGQLAEQLVGFFRDLMVAAVGGEADMMLYTAAGEYSQVQAAAQNFGLETILAAIQILDQAIARMRQSTQVRTLVEMAVVRICKLEDLEELSKLMARLRDGGAVALPSQPAVAPAAAALPGSAAQKKNEPLTPPPAATAAPSPPPSATNRGRPLTPSPATSASPEPRSATETVVPTPATGEHAGESRVADANPPLLDATAAESHFRQAVEEIGGMTADIAGGFTSLAISGPNLLVVNLRTAYNKQWCDRLDVKRKVEQTLSRLIGREMRIEFAVVPGTEATAAAPRPQPPTSRVKKLREIEKHPLVREAVELFNCEVVRIDEKRTTP